MARRGAIQMWVATASSVHDGWRTHRRNTAGRNAPVRPTVAFLDCSLDRSISPPMGLTVAALPRASGLEVPASALGSPCSTPQTPTAADRDGPIPDVSKERPVAIPLQSLLDTRPEAD